MNKLEIAYETYKENKRKYTKIFLIYLLYTIFLPTVLISLNLVSETVLPFLTTALSVLFIPLSLGVWYAVYKMRTVKDYTFNDLHVFYSQNTKLAFLVGGFYLLINMLLNQLVQIVNYGLTAHNFENAKELMPEAIKADQVITTYLGFDLLSIEYKYYLIGFALFIVLMTAFLIRFAFFRLLFVDEENEYTFSEILKKSGQLIKGYKAALLKTYLFIFLIAVALFIIIAILYSISLFLGTIGLIIMLGLIYLIFKVSLIGYSTITIYITNLYFEAKA